MNERRRARARAPQSDRLVGLPSKETECGTSMRYRRYIGRFALINNKKTKYGTFVHLHVCYAPPIHQFIDRFTLKNGMPQFFFCSCVVLCLVELCGGGMATICLERGGGARTRPRLPVAKVVEYFHFCRHDRLPSINYRKASERCIVAPNIPCYFVFAFLALAFSTFF